jgi:hypothetical protein
MSVDYELRNWAEVNALARKVDPSTFGRLCQSLLALSFLQAGYEISHFQFVGRPDFVAKRDLLSYSVEAKAPSGPTVILKVQDLMGIRGLGHKPIVAVLSYPMLSTAWLIVDATRLAPGTYTKLKLKTLSDPILQREVSENFFEVVSNFAERMLENAFDGLKNLLTSPPRTISQISTPNQ